HWSVPTSPDSSKKNFLQPGNESAPAKLREASDGASLAAIIKASRAWRDGYQKWGRTTMGFGFYFFEMALKSVGNAPRA
ncbi:MAG: hypothetical protein ACKVI3_20420, partial [Verrucomicrobiia bacterium]